MSKTDTPPKRIFIPTHAANTIALFEARGHKVTVRLNRHGSNRYKLDEEPERSARELCSRFARLYE